MTRETYQQSLDQLEVDVLEMGNLVLERFEDALESLETADDALAERVIEGDRQINDRYLELEMRCVDLFALQQPVAGDLRFVTASFKIITDLERVGDLATNIARYATSTSQELADLVPLVDIGREAATLLERSLGAYANADAEATKTIAEADDRVDALCKRSSETVTRELIEREATEDGWSVEELLDDVSRVLLTIRDLERVADHAVNIAARTLYMVENDSALLY